jgi:hypothetical protein
MKTLHFSVVIDAPRPHVWYCMLGPETFKQWTAPFAEGSYFEGSWEQGERIRFLTPNGEGMTSTIVENRPYEFVSIKHLGIVKDGVEDTESEAARAWTPAYENYTFFDRSDSTELRIDVDVAPDYEDYMNTAWPRALERLKALCEEIA